jgi:signal transduction histidine kinase
MDNLLLLTLLVMAILAIIFLAGRRLYLRSQRIRRRLQLSAIFTNITHELLTPLSVISASIDKLRDTEPQYSREYDLMQLNIQRMVRLLQQILETSKSDAGQLRLLVAQGDVMKYIRQTAECLSPLIAKKDMKFSIVCQPESMMGWIDTDKFDKIIAQIEFHIPRTRPAAVRAFLVIGADAFGLTACAVPVAPAVALFAAARTLDAVAADIGQSALRTDPV